MSHLLNHPKPRRIDKKRIQRHAERAREIRALEYQWQLLQAMNDAICGVSSTKPRGWWSRKFGR